MQLIKRNMALVIWFICINFLMHAQDGEFAFRKAIPLKANMMAVDELGFIYLVRDNEVMKLGTDAKVLFTRSNLSSGDITSINVSDPFKVMLFYKDFGTIEFLDNTLSLTNTISLDVFGLQLSTLAAMSYNNGFWVYNPQNMELVRINQFLNISDRTGNIAKVTGKEINPNFLLEKDDMVFLNDPKHGILMFDKYGAYYKTIKASGIAYFQVYDRKLVFFEKGRMVILDPVTLDQISFPLPANKHKELSISLGKETNRLYSLESDTLKIYVLNKSF
jgi:hypothetical protein